MPLIVYCFFATLLTAVWGSKLEGSYEEERRKMVFSQIQRRGISDQATLKAMGRVQRHQFVPSDLIKFAYHDGPLRIGYGQTISQPYIVAYMTEKLKLQPEHRVLEIGTGSGYQAAVLAEIVDTVYTVEIIPQLAARTSAKMQLLGYKNIHTRQVDGFHGWAEEAPFDAIIVTAAASFIPPPLLDQLKEGGRMIIPVGPSFGAQYLLIIVKKNGKIRTKTDIPVRFVPFTRK